MNTSALVLVSGGLDSSTCLAIAAKQGYRLYGLSFNYGQRHKLELQAAQEQAGHYKLERHLILDLDLRLIGGSALTGDFEVPKAEKIEEPVQAGIPITYVPARNTIFLSIALGWAEVLQAQAIFIGVNALDYSGYPDCRPEFVEAFQNLARIATKQGIEKQPITIEAPLLHLNKSEIIQLGHQLGVDYGLTWSCYDPTPEKKVCGRCDACRLRAKGFQAANLRDPLLDL